jgi:hypothetical protein
MIAACKYEISVICVISEDEYIPICEKFGFQWVHYDNKPLGDKINHGIKQALKTDCTYIMMMNSDDVIDAELLNTWYRPYFDKRAAFFGINRVTYVKFGTEEAREVVYNFSVLGIGKCIRSDVAKMAFKRLGYLYRPTLGKGLDDNMLDNLMQMGVSASIVPYTGQLAFDFKSEVNIWPWETFANKGTATCYKHGYELESSTN